MGKRGKIAKKTELRKSHSPPSGTAGGRCTPAPPFCTGLSPPTLPAGDRINHYKLINYFPPASPAGGKSFKVGGGSRPPESPLSAGLPAGGKSLIIFSAGLPGRRPPTRPEIIKVGGGSRPSPNPPFAPAYRPVIGSIIKVGGAPAPPEPTLCTVLSPPSLPAGDRINHHKLINSFPPASPAGGKSLGGITLLLL